MRLKVAREALLAIDDDVKKNRPQFAYVVVEIVVQGLKSLLAGLSRPMRPTPQVYHAAPG